MNNFFGLYYIYCLYFTEIILGSPCKGTNQCKDSKATCMGTCKCKDGFYKDNSNVCSPRMCFIYFSNNAPKHFNENIDYMIEQYTDILFEDKYQ